MSKHPEIKGAILAGGKATRMGGAAKGMLGDKKGQPIVAGLISRMQRAGINDIVIAADEAGPYAALGVPVVPDVRTGAGPVAGIEAVLAHFRGRCEGVMFMPCDIPNVTTAELTVLKAAFVRSNAKIICAETGDFFWHPLCTIVHNEMGPQISAILDQGQTKVQDIWRRLGAEPVRFTETKAFLNLNSFSDVNRWRKETNEQKMLC